VVAETRKTERVQQYAKRWDKDSSKDTDAHKQSRLDEYTEVVNGQSCSLLGIPGRVARRTSEALWDMQLIRQATTMVLPSCTSSAGPSLSTSPGSSREKVSSSLCVHPPPQSFNPH
jgi:sterol 24-C-methyltransferase